MVSGRGWRVDSQLLTPPLPNGPRPYTPKQFKKGLIAGVIRDPGFFLGGTLGGGGLHG